MIIALAGLFVYIIALVVTAHFSFTFALALLTVGCAAASFFSGYLQS